MKINVEINLDSCCSATYVTVAKLLAQISDLTKAGVSEPLVRSRVTGDIETLGVVTSVTGSTGVELDPASVVTVPLADEKPKRKRRTKAQIAADEAAATGVTEIPAVVEAPVAVTAAAAPAAVVVDPLADAPAEVNHPLPTEAEVKQAVVDACARLTAGGDPNPVVAVVAKLVEVTGKQRVHEIAPDRYHDVIAALLEIDVPVASDDPF